MIQFDTITLPAAELGSLNPFPDILNNTYIHAGYEMTGRVTAEDAENIGKGMIPTMLPYLTQDGYSRKREEKKIPAVILENKYLRAVFLPSLGGRLWSLTDLEHHRELLYVNPVFQPCNLALRNAWFSGGVEFNVGIKGHNPFTCSPLFARVSRDAAGNEVLSLYEFERIRGVTFSVNAWLPENSRILFVKNVIENTAPTSTYMYWWTNMAIPKTPGTRILVPTERSFVSFYQEDHYVLDVTDIPKALGTDVSYPSNMNRSLDFFYQLPDAAQKWIASADEAGSGLLHFSQSLLRGRKLFLWGQGNGGKHWGEFLAGAEPHSGEGYLEIQAGLARTQLEHFVMPGNSTLQWTECFAALNASPKALHGDWNEAQKAVEHALSEYTGGKTADEFLQERFPDLTSLRDEKMLYAGSGWGALENRVRKELRLPPISRLFSCWESEQTSETAFWDGLLRGKLPASDPLADPAGYMNQLPYQNGFWEEKLRLATERDGQNSVLLNQYGVTLYASGKKEEAETCWQTAARLGDPFALRNLAVYRFNEQGKTEDACRTIEQAVEILPAHLRLAREYASILCGCGDERQAERFLSRFAEFPASIREDGRMKLWKIRALLILGKTDEASVLLSPDFTVADIKEGELSMSALWFEIHARKLAEERGISRAEALPLAKQAFPLPYTLDFRMHE